MIDKALKVLLVEDNPGDIRLIREMLADAGLGALELECAEHLQAGLERLSKGDINAVLLDLSLPDSHGLDTFARTYTQTPWVPIIILTGFDDEELAARAVREGAQDYLVKGQINGNLLTRAIRYSIERQRAEETRHRLLLEMERLAYRLTDLEDEESHRVALDLHEGLGQLIFAVRQREALSFDEMAMTLERRLAAARRQRELEAEFVYAAELQASLLPPGNLALPGFEVAARCLPAREVGGDFYDWHLTSPGVLSLTVGDVMGKGMRAALLMAETRAAVRAFTRRLSPAKAVHQAEQALESYLQRTESFVTLFHAQLDAARRRLVYVDAGHGYAFVRRADGAIETLRSTNLPLGISLNGEKSYREDSLVLRSGDTLVVYSDGLIEGQLELADHPLQLGKQVEGAASVGEVIDRLLVFAGVSSLPTDDVTIMVVRCQEAARMRPRAAHAPGRSAP